jgi:hypothetical protein
MGVNSTDAKELKRMSRHFHNSAKNKVRTMERIHDTISKSQRYNDDIDDVDLEDPELWEEIYMSSDDDFLKQISGKKLGKYIADEY